MENALFTFQDREGNRFQLTLSPYDPYLLSEQDRENQRFTTGLLSPYNYEQHPLWETALRGIEEESYPLYPKDPFSAFWFEYLEEHKTVYFQSNMGTDLPDKKFGDFTVLKLRK